MTNKKSRFIPLIFAVCIALGIVIGAFYGKQNQGNRPNPVTSSNKISALLRVIEDKYVDTVDVFNLIEEAMPQILGELDPHSIYIPAKDLEEVNSELEASFSGIGIQFSIQSDTIHVNSVVPGGPSEKVGLMGGDRIVKVNDSLFVGKELTNERAMRALKGPKGTEVKVSIKRATEKDLLDFVIVRGDIPQHSINASYMLDKDFGYIQISKFGRTTHLEMISALAELSHYNCKGVIIDLRDNTGGFMESAIHMVNEFLPANQLIVYTEGRNFPSMREYADGTGSFQQLPIVVLVNENSASASEIFAGAIQDNDRGTIVGRRSFGKGLVQEPIEFSDGSAIRLTIARYHTPSGRCIQRPYENGKDEHYNLDWVERYEKGEFFSEDSIKQNKELQYTTGLGRIVYGGGGIMPDVFVPQDTTGVSSYLIEVSNKGLITQYSFNYSDNNRPELTKYESWNDLLTHLEKQNVVHSFIRYADSKGVKRRNLLIQQSFTLLERYLYGNIIYNILGQEEYIKFLNQSDDTVKRALQILQKGESFPKAPETNNLEVANNG